MECEIFVSPIGKNAGTHDEGHQKPGTQYHQPSSMLAWAAAGQMRATHAMCSLLPILIAMGKV